MACFYDFTSGYFADNIINALKANCSMKALLELNKKKLLVLCGENKLITPQSLSYDALEEYADATGVPVSYFFFNAPVPPIPNHTPFDAEVIWHLDHLSIEKLVAFSGAMKICFPNRMYAEAAQLPVNRRMLRLISAWPPGALTDTAHMLEKSEDPIEKVVYCELARYRASHHSAKFAFSSNAWIALSSYMRISLHWLFQLKCPLYCHTQLADDLFDYYTLLDPKQQECFYRCLTGKGETIL